MPLRLRIDKAHPRFGTGVVDVVQYALPQGRDLVPDIGQHPAVVHVVNVGHQLVASGYLGIWDDLPDDIGGAGRGRMGSSQVWVAITRSKYAATRAWCASRPKTPE